MENGASDTAHNGVSALITAVPDSKQNAPLFSNDEKAPDSSDSGPQKGRPIKGKKRKKPKDTTAPRHPLTGTNKFFISSLHPFHLFKYRISIITGYVRFLNDRREGVRQQNPSLPFAEITKILASEWSNLPTDKKQQYLDAAEQDRERYTREYNAYKQTDAYKLFTQQQNEKKIKESNNKDETHKVVRFYS